MQRIEGLSIGLSLDTLKVDSGLKDLKRKLSLVNSEMKANLSVFDRSENSLDKYQVKIDGLNKKLDVQRKVTENARKHYEKMVKEHGEGSAEAEKAARAYNNEVAKLNNLERQIKDVTSQMKEFQRQQKIQNSTLFKAGDSLIKFGSGLKSMSDKMKDVGKSLTTKITAPAVGAASALAGVALVKGFDRLVGIDTARAKLQGLGHDAKGVEKIMESALESVRGTSFGMDEAATTAANAVAAGVKEGKELTRYLSLTGDAAAIAGSSMSEMGSILNKVKTSNKAYNGELQQLSDRGLPVYQWLAKEAGVAADAVFDMASDGQISSEMLMNAIEKNIGGAAKKMGETSFTAGIANMWAAVGRLGASFLDAGGKGGGFFSQLKPLIADFTGRIDSMGGIAEKAGVKFGEMFAGFVDKVKSVKSWFDSLSPSMQDIIKKGALLGTVVAVGVGPALTVLGSLGGMIANISIGLGTFMKFLAPVTKGFSLFGGAAGTAGTSVGFLGKAFAVLTGPIGITVGIIAALTAGFVLLYKKSDSFRESVGKLTASLKELGGKVLGHLKDSIGAVTSFFKDQLSMIKGFWKSDGGSIISAAENIGNVITTVFRGIFKVIDFIMPAVLAIIKSVWGNIKGVIQGALKVIMGLVQVFSGLFTGDFKKMWEGIKNIFSGALQFIWNYVQLMFWGKMLKGIINLGKLLANAFKNSWTGIKNIVSNLVKSIVDFVKDRFTKSKDTVNSIFLKLKDLTKVAWNLTKDIIINAVKSAVNTVRLRFSAARDNIRTIFEKIKEITKSAWDSIKNRIVNPVKSAVDTARSRFSNFRQAVSDIFRKTKDKVGEYVSSMVKTVKDMPGKMAKGIKDMGYKLYNSAKGVANRLVKGLGLGVNGVITGVNWVLKRVGVDKKLDPWPVPKYAKGTDGHPGGLARVGDGGMKELVRTPDGNMFLSPNKDTLVNLPKGTSVLSGPETKALLSMFPAYKNGIGDVLKDMYKSTKNKAGGIVKSGIDKVKSAGQKLKEIGLDVWDYISKPGTLMKKVWDKFIPDMGLSGIQGSIAKGAIKMIKSHALEWVKGQMPVMDVGESFSFGAPFHRTSGFGMRWGRLHKGVDWAAPAGTPIPAVAGGKVIFSGFGRRGSGYGGYGNVIHIQGANGLSYLYAHNSKNKVKVGQAVSKGQIIGLVGSTGDSTGPHVHFEVRRNGQAINPDTLGGGNVSGSVKKWIAQGMARAGVSGSDWLNGLSWIIQRESSGNPRAVGAMTSTGTAKGLMQLMDFNYTGNPFDPVNNIFHGIRYIKNRYGSIGKAVSFWKRNNWYATGGRIKNPGIYGLAEGGWPEYVIPTDPKRRTDAMKLLALAGREISGNKRPHQLPNVGGNDDSVLMKLLAATMEQNEILKQILAKNPDLYMDSEKVGKAVEPTVTKQQQLKAYRGRRAPGFA